MRSIIKNQSRDIFLVKVVGSESRQVKYTVAKDNIVVEENKNMGFRRFNLKLFCNFRRKLDRSFRGFIIC